MTDFKIPVQIEMNNIDDDTAELCLKIVQTFCNKKKVTITKRTYEDGSTGLEFVPYKGFEAEYV